MRNLTIYLTGFLCLFITQLFGQDTSASELAKQSFEQRTKALADRIEAITKEEKDALKLEIESVNAQLENGSITPAEAEAKKLKLADSRAKSIEARVAVVEADLKTLIQEKVDGKITETDTSKDKQHLGITWNAKADRKKKEENGEPRSTSQFVFAFGANNLVTDGAVANSDFSYARSHFFEWGVTDNIRLAKNSNLLHFKYGLTFVYNTLKATDNRIFTDTGDQTILVTSPVAMRNKGTYFKNVFVTLPIHFEFDFSKTETKDGKKIFRSHEGFRMGFGGFVGYNINSKQFLSYRVDGYKIHQKQKGNWNIEDWNYGVSAYVGYKETSLYVKYDINPMFKNNTVDQNNISAGIRFDFN